SNRTAGTWLAVTYAVPKQVSPTGWEKTTVRPKPASRAPTVLTAMSNAAVPTPCVTPPSGTTRDTVPSAYAPTPQIDPATWRHPVDDPRETGAFTGQCQGKHTTEQGRTHRTFDLGHSRHPQSGTKRIGPGIPQHGAFGEFVGKERDRSTHGRAEQGGGR